MVADQLLSSCMLTPLGHAIPLTVRISFYVGAAAFFSAVLWTILTTKEYPPDDLGVSPEEVGASQER